MAYRNNWTITTTGNTPPGSFHWYDGSFGSFDLNIKKCPCGCQCASSKNSSFQLEIGIVKIVYKKCPNENGMFHKEIESFEIDGKIFK